MPKRQRKPHKIRLLRPLPFDPPSAESGGKMSANPPPLCGRRRGLSCERCPARDDDVLESALVLPDRERDDEALNVRELALMFASSVAHQGLRGWEITVVDRSIWLVKLQTISAQPPSSRLKFLSLER